MKKVFWLYFPLLDLVIEVAFYEWQMNEKVDWLDLALADALLELVIEVATRSRDQTDPSLKIETLNLQNLNTICENTDRPVAENENFKLKKDFHSI